MNCAVIAFTRRGAELGQRLAAGLGCTLYAPSRFAAAAGAVDYGSLGGWTKAHWDRGDSLIFVGAAGIAVRAVAPHVQDKFTDPAVISVDEAGGYVVPLLSGHVGGGNALAWKIAALIGGQAVISTATDVNGLFAADVWATAHALAITDRTLAKEISAALLEGQPVGFTSSLGHPCPAGLTQGAAELGIWVTCRQGEQPYPRTLTLVPKRLVLGIGCRRGVGVATIEAAVAAAMADYHSAAVVQVSSIDLKRDERGLLDYCQRRGLPLVTYTAAELAAVPGAFTPSEFVQRITGVDNVCERAALAGGGRLLVQKQAQNGVTVALAILDEEIGL